MGSIQARLEAAFHTKFLLQCYATNMITFGPEYYIESNLVYLYQVYINEANTQLKNNIYEHTDNFLIQVFLTLAVLFFLKIYFFIY